MMHLKVMYKILYVSCFWDTVARTICAYVVYYKVHY